jgi:hypothetical protein
LPFNRTYNIGEVAVLENNTSIIAPRPAQIRISGGTAGWIGSESYFALDSQLDAIRRIYGVGNTDAFSNAKYPDEVSLSRP